jgi:hypothetical protein
MSYNKWIIILVFSVAVSSMLSAHDEVEAENGMRAFNVKNFTSIRNRTGADIEIRLGEDWKIEASGNRRGVRNLRIFKRDGELIIGSRFGFLFYGRIIYKPVLITICMPGHDLESVRVMASGDATIIGNLQSDETFLKTAARGSIIATGDVDYLTLRSSASGDITFAGNCREVDVALSASGDANLEINTDILRAKASASGSLYVDGQARDSEIRLTASGQFMGKNFTTDDADVRISASGDAELRIENGVDARLSAGGNLYYWGTPQIGKIRTTGRGGLESRN